MGREPCAGSWELGIETSADPGMISPQRGFRVAIVTEPQEYYPGFWVFSAPLARASTAMAWRFHGSMDPKLVRTVNASHLALALRRVITHRRPSPCDQGTLNATTPRALQCRAHRFERKLNGPMAKDDRSTSYLLHHCWFLLLRIRDEDVTLL